MPKSPRRMGFQIHLSTAIVLMFAAGGLIWANVTPEKWWSDFATEHGLCFPHDTIEDSPFAGPGIQINLGAGNILGISDDPTGEIDYFGWPLVAAERTAFPQAGFGQAPANHEDVSFYSYRETPINILFALALLTVVYCACEWRIRRRPARKQIDSGPATTTIPE